MSRQYVLHPQALADIEEIWTDIARDNPDPADRVVEELFAAMERLAESPLIGHRRADLSSRPLRFWLVRSYLIAYAPDASQLAVVAVLHGRRILACSRPCSAKDRKVIREPACAADSAVTGYHPGSRSLGRQLTKM